MSWIDPVYDRTSLNPGNLGITEITRIKNNIDEINVLILSYGYDIPTLQTITIPTNSDFPWASEINKLVSNIEILRKSVFPSTISIDYPDSIFFTEYQTLKKDYQALQALNPTTPTQGYVIVNYWEKNLYLLRWVILEALNYNILGTFNCGEEGVMA